MTHLPIQGQTLPGKSGPNVYTALLLVAILTLIVAAAVLIHYLTAPLPNGYGLSFSELFGSAELPK